MVNWFKMRRFYLRNRLFILNVILLISLLAAFAFPADSFARNFLFGLAAGTAIVTLANGITKTKNIE